MVDAVGEVCRCAVRRSTIRWVRQSKCDTVGAVRHGEVQRGAVRWFSRVGVLRWVRYGVIRYDGAGRRVRYGRTVNGKSKYANRKPICDFIFDDISNVCHICHHFRDIRSQNEHACP